MIPDMGPHAVFIWLSYAMTAAVLSGLITWLIADGRRQTRLLAQYDARSGKARSADGKSP